MQSRPGHDRGYVRYHEVERFKKFQRSLLGIKDATSVADIDIKNYAKYILKDGTDVEKRELLSCLKNKISLNEKLISIDT